MARKRMISPEIWESSSFSKLSDFAKLVFIGLFSNADDSGKGSADAGLLKSKLFPRDEKKRVTDITNALSDIARHMSISFYEVEGNNYYILTAWRKWQKIDRPTPSKLPNPPETMGERGRTTQNSNFDEDSTSIQRGLDEGSTPNGIERKGIENINIPPGAGAREEEQPLFETEFNAFCKKWDIAVDTCSPYMDDLNFVNLDKAFSESSTYLQDKEQAPWAHTLSGILKNYRSICAGKYKDRARGKAKPKQQKEQDTHDMLQDLFEHYKGKENNDGTN